MKEKYMEVQCQNCGAVWDTMIVASQRRVDGMFEVILKRCPICLSDILEDLGL